MMVLENQVLIYTTEDGLSKIETTFDRDTVWLSIDQMAELFQRDKSTISRHIKNIYTEEESKRKIYRGVKDRLFRFLFTQDREALLQLYNALNGTDYQDAQH